MPAVGQSTVTCPSCSTSHETVLTPRYSSRRHQQTLQQYCGRLNQYCRCHCGDKDTVVVLRTLHTFVVVSMRDDQWARVPHSSTLQNLFLAFGC